MNEVMKQNKVVALVGASATGKSTVERILQDTYGMKRAISCTTRPKRHYEQDGVDYYFVTNEEVEEMSQEGLLVERTLFNNWSYCLTGAEFEDSDVVVIEPNGLRQIIHNVGRENVFTGVFAHESFGHKSESDFMIGDETMKREWALGTKVGVDMLNIYDTGSPDGSGYVPYDDEGTKATKTYLIKDGILTGRLHSAYTAAALEEAVTGNARAMSFEYEPIVRMTSTCIGGGDLTVDELIGSVKEGVYIKDYKHGSGMSTFTIAPNVAYMIRDGKLAEPVRIAIIIGNVMETLHQIDGLANDTRLCSSASGGCGKMEQWPLRVAFGGPHMRVNGIQVQ